MENRGALLSCDIYPGKCRTMEQRAQAFGVTIMRTAARDASAPCPEPLRGAFDRVLCDVPCSGWGVIRRKPEIRYKDPASFDALPELQYRILEQSAQMVRPGGVLQYSTCTWSRRENEEVAARFLEAHPEFAPRVLPLGRLLCGRGTDAGSIHNPVPGRARHRRFFHWPVLSVRRTKIPADRCGRRLLHIEV